MLDLNRAQTRLDNIRSVQPILSALHTISLGSWQAALNRVTWVEQYRERLATLLPPLSRAALPRRDSPPASREGMRGGLLLVIGSERGLCGRFNAAIAERASAYLADTEAGGAPIELTALGSRLARTLERHGHQPDRQIKLSTTALPSADLASRLSHDWLARYETRALDTVDVAYNAYGGMGGYEPAVTRLIPPVFAPTPAEQGGDTEPPIIETDPLSLYARVIEQLAATRLYEILLSSAAAEHAARYELMEAATQNTEALIEELMLSIQTARQQAITQEMQELAAGAGMIGQPA